MMQSETTTLLPEDTTDVLDFAGVDQVALACLNLDTMSVDNLAAWLYDHGAAHLSPIARIELAERLTRRRFLIGAGAVSLGAIVGCGAEEPAAPTGAGFRVFVDARGKAVRVPDVPERIVALHDHNAGGPLLSLGAPVVGMTTRGGDGEFAKDIARFFDLSDVTTVGVANEPNLEVVLSLNPDLLVGYVLPDGRIFLTDDEIEALEAIAPLVFIQPFRSVAEVMTDFDELVGDAATVSLEEQEAEFEMKLEELRSVFGEDWKDVTASYIFIDPDNTLFVPGPTLILPLQILTQVGVTWSPPHMEAGETEAGFRNGISIEELSQFQSDLAVLESPTLDTTDFDIPLVQQLPAVKAGQVISIDIDLNGPFYPVHIAMIDLMLEDLRAIEDFNIDLIEEDASN